VPAQLLVCAGVETASAAQALWPWGMLTILMACTTAVLPMSAASVLFPALVRRQGGGSKSAGVGVWVRVWMRQKGMAGSGSTQAGCRA